MKRRSFVKTASSWALLGALPCGVGNVYGADNERSIEKTSNRRWDIHDPLNYTPDPDVITLKEEFSDLINGNAAIHRVWNGGGWLEGPAWSEEGRFLLLSDTINSRYYRYLWETGEVTVFPLHSYNGNGNIFDSDGRLLCCEHFLRRLVRWEHDGSMTVLADSYKGKPLNSPNDVVVHKDGSIWFSDPSYGDLIDEGHGDAPGGSANPHGKIRYKIGVEFPSKNMGMDRQPDHVFRIGLDGKIEAVVGEDEICNPNGLCFSPDYKRLYVASTGSPKKSFHHDGAKAIHLYDVGEKGTLHNHRIFSSMRYFGAQMYADGIKCDVQGNLWCGVSGPLGFCGVFIYNPSGELIGRIRLPQGVSNLTFGGPKRNWLFMCAGEDLYRLMVGTQGAAPS